MVTQRIWSVWCLHVLVEKLPHLLMTSAEEPKVCLSDLLNGIISGMLSNILVVIIDAMHIGRFKRHLEYRMQSFPSSIRWLSCGHSFDSIQRSGPCLFKWLFPLSLGHRSSRNLKHIFFLKNYFRRLLSREWLFSRYLLIHLILWLLSCNFQGHLCVIMILCLLKFRWLFW